MIKLSKSCPNCGQQLEKGDRFCPNCGYDVANFDKTLKATASDNDNNFKQENIKENHEDNKKSCDAKEETREFERSQKLKKSNKKHHNQRTLIIVAVIIILFLISGFFLYSKNNNSGNTNNASSSSNSSSYQSSSSSSTDSDDNDNSDSSSKLSMSMGPKETASAITYYAAKHGNKDWKAMLDGGAITVRLDQDDDHLDKLNDAGSGMAYDVFGYKDVASDDDTEFVYTLDKDNTVNIYKIDDGIDAGDDDNDPIESVSKSTIIDWLNDNGYASHVKQLSNHTDIEQ